MTLKEILNAVTLMSRASFMSLVILGSASAQTAGGFGPGNGGGALVCRDNNGKIEYAMFFDLYKEDQLMDLKFKVQSEKEIYSALVETLSHINEPLAKDFIDEYKVVEEKMLQNPRTWKTAAIFGDFRFIQQPDLCPNGSNLVPRYEQVGFYAENGEFSHNEDIVAHFSPLSIVAFKSHEALYRIWTDRLFRERNSDEIRELNYQLLATLTSIDSLSKTCQTINEAFRYRRGSRLEQMHQAKSQRRTELLQREKANDRYFYLRNGLAKESYAQAEEVINKEFGDLPKFSLLSRYDSERVWKNDFLEPFLRQIEAAVSSSDELQKFPGKLMTLSNKTVNFCGSQSLVNFNGKNPMEKAWTQMVIGYHQAKKPWMPSKSEKTILQQTLPASLALIKAFPSIPWKDLKYRVAINLDDFMVENNGIGPKQNGFTPLMLAALVGDVPSVKFLLEAHNFDKNSKTEEGKTALDYATDKSVKAVLK